MIDANGQSLAYFYARDNDHDANTAGVLTLDERKADGEQLRQTAGAARPRQKRRLRPSPIGMVEVQTLVLRLRIGCNIQSLTTHPARLNYTALGGDTHMYRNNLIAWALSVCLIALIPTAGTAKTGDVKTSMTALQAETAKLGAAEGSRQRPLLRQHQGYQWSSSRCEEGARGCGHHLRKEWGPVHACGHDGKEGRRFKCGGNGARRKQPRHCKTQQWRTVLRRCDRLREDLRRWI